MRKDNETGACARGSSVEQSMLTVGPVSGLTVSLCEKTLALCIATEGAEWETERFVRPVVATQEEELDFSRWQSIHHETVKTGYGRGIRSSFRLLDGKEDSYAFDTLCWIEETGEEPGASRAGRVHFEWIPIRESGLRVKEVRWPAPLFLAADKESGAAGECGPVGKESGAAEENSAACKESGAAGEDGAAGKESGAPRRYTLINEGQGLLLPDDWQTEVNRLSFRGQFLTAGGYMPWFGQVKERRGYIAIADTPWNAGAYVEHPAGGPYTRIGLWWEPSLGKMDYRRSAVFTFLDDCGYNDMCRIYRTYAKETGKLVTLKEKAARLPSVEKLYGCAFVHCGIKTNVHPLSDFYDERQPKKNNHVTSFSKRAGLIRDIRKRGVEKLYLHLDGWAEPGYDNKHPDYLPACREAGGWEGMKQLVDTVHGCGYLFGIHDQYRDYYLNAESFDENEAVRLPDGTIPQHSRWAGGPQSYLCATRAPYYVKRNFHEIFSHGIKMDGAYLDVFTCNEGDECDNPYHRMSRRECYDYRKQCFDWLLSQGILPSSEEVSDWSMQSLVFCHYAPYHFMLQAPGTPRNGIAVPLFNLVYHDCVVEPWMMDILEYEDAAGKKCREDLMLYALLNAGAPYLIRDGAYENTDGSFAGCGELGPEETMERCRVVQRLHERLADCPMLCHELLNADGTRQRTVFADGTRVTVDLEKGTYQIEEG